MNTCVEQAARVIQDAQRVEVFTGAGMSAESGLDTFRDATTGIWSKVDPQAMASIGAWAKDPEPMWRWYLHRRDLALRAQPHAGHRAVAASAKTAVTTQNIDDLHERAGSGTVTHLHGSLFEFRCSICARPWRGEVHPETIPECPLCGNLIRPGVVWFGEALPHREWEEAEQRMSTADAVIIVGTSGVVQPAASLPLVAFDLGTPVLEVSPVATELSRYSRLIQGTAEKVLPALL
ncbi:NAD-dependent deacetylase [Corynebacterium phocae]|uniref:NAD-dependent protein deacylase n=1 Tax=Corynebacterium phocae TaxID=161895 RepID=A0A1L7D0F4_9CORY|nr:NAD-dependent deacylase [Corynebacterium phocae]APT91626.1 NAD-dependent deacetylase [Corynebacterium phocae]KAA8720704.1 NAD-dependent deacylase [Corynebacterium phocae]